MLQVLLRMSTHNGFGEKAEGGERLSPKAHASLIYNSYLFDIPKLLDISTIYASVDSDLAQKVLSNVFRAQQLYYKDLTEALNLAAQALDRSSDEILELAREARDGASLQNDAISDACFYLADSGFTLLAFIRVFGDAAKYCVQSKLHLAVVRAYTRFTAAFARKGLGLENFNLVDETLQKRVRGAFLDFIGETVDRVGLNFIQKGKGGMRELVRLQEELKAISEAGIGHGKNRFLRDLDHRRSLCARLEHCQKGRPKNEADKCAEMIHIVSSSRDGGGDHQHPRAADSEGAGRAVDEVTPQPSGSDMVSIKQIREIFSDLGEGFAFALLKSMDNNVERVIQSLLEGNIPPELESMDRSAPLEQPQAKQALAAGGPATAVAAGGTASAESTAGGVPKKSYLDARANIFDGDEFDVMRGNVSMDNVYVKGRPASKVVVEEGDSQEAQALKLRVKLLAEQQVIQELQDDLVAAMAAEAAGAAGASEWVKRARSKLDNTTGDVGIGEDAMYDDEYDDGMDELGIVSVAERAAEGESMVSVKQVPNEVVRGIRKNLGLRAAASADDDDELDDADWVTGNPNRPREFEVDEEREDGNVLDDEDLKEDDTSCEKPGVRRWAPAGRGRGRGGGAPLAPSAEEKAARGRGWGTANAKQARRKEENKAKVGNHHRKDRASRKMRQAGLPG